ncbi:MAG: tRNA uridine-5-carboxymethylaminomethyl(34) synthesis GTPase MnmE [Bacilli bacterium]|jgi:tRNA modification GTPase|nr:tRNA uridine-5-carboxymethylaminomethyl(34) synthesis GTPase MnmE [Bacilli bacterium]MDD3389083.1 tRNA uridine-5-carboxymethylaminomethyl(34) synthesis GTPase MnmE [Bacilli bacterium]MDD4344722.1 tRNA uridine-5-carboxymethylaminomethyl(34) synthesis GTPase MnmE [Bacilli bacterium]MDD4520833.1 tRNA uridine-5-carboxymethylaminomethyl(34) synthesis GTPase MnmE [Bacilli bacterium]MDY0399655.1 tRNA uridine-5-carboxymethylaminomethyl(34) synthesis GTPase MnmE [Bacilli bacterium]
MKLETIVALATPPLKSALGIIRLSGMETFTIINRVFFTNTGSLSERGIYHGWIKDGDETIDEVVVLAYIQPKSYTGEDLVEIIFHGSPLIAQQILSILIKYGARSAEPGEFSSRAFLNNKIDLIQAEAINDMINATSLEAKKLALYSLKGETSDKILPVQVKIADLVSLIEVNIDYPEYTDIEIATTEKVLADTNEITKAIDLLIDEGRQGKIIKEGLKVAIVGKPNVGKSSLLNALIGEEKAIVTNVAGTTRDIVEGEINLDGIILHLYDTAGIRESQDQIESIGIGKAKQVLTDADLIILVIDGSRTLDEEDQKILELTQERKRLIVYNKSDLTNIEKHDGKLYVSALTKDISALKRAIVKLFAIDNASFSRPSLTNARQLGLLAQAKQNLLTAQELAKQKIPLDLINVELQAALMAINDVLGKTGDSDLSQEIFSRFCLGK